MRESAKKTLSVALIIIGVVAVLGEPMATESDALWLKQMIASKLIAFALMYAGYRLGIKAGMWNKWNIDNN